MSKTVRHRWPLATTGRTPETCLREGCGLQRRFSDREKRAPGSGFYRRLRITTVEEYSLDGGRTWTELAELGGRVPECKGKLDEAPIRKEVEAFRTAQRLANETGKPADIYRLKTPAGKTKGWAVREQPADGSRGMAGAELLADVWPEKPQGKET